MTDKCGIPAAGLFTLSHSFHFILAILDQPFRFLAQWRIKALARAVSGGRHRRLRVTMPISKRFFLKASTKYWLDYGARSGITGAQMATMEIEGEP